MLPERLPLIRTYEAPMQKNLTITVEEDEGWFIAYTPDFPGANGQGRNKEAALQNLRDAVQLIEQDNQEETLNHR